MDQLTIDVGQRIIAYVIVHDTGNYWLIDDLQTDAGCTLELVGLEVTQSIQDWENSVVLVENKPTYVRAHIQTVDGLQPDVVGLLHGFRDGVSLPGSPLSPANPRSVPYSRASL